MFEAFCKEKLGPLVLRLAVGAVCAGHGFLKIMAAGGTDWFPSWPVGWQLLIAWGEFAGGLAILLGLRCRWAAGLVLLIVAGTLAAWHGWELFRLPVRSLEPTLLFLFGALALVLLGAGELSLDARGGRGNRSAGKPQRSRAA